MHESLNEDRHCNLNTIANQYHFIKVTTALTISPVVSSGDRQIDLLTKVARHTKLPQILHDTINNEKC